MLRGVLLALIVPEAQQHVAGLERVERALTQTVAHRAQEYAIDVGHRPDDSIGHLVLHGQQVGLSEFAVVMVAPQLLLVFGVQYPRRNPQLLRGAPDAALEDEPDAELLTHLSEIAARALESFCGVLRGDGQIRKTRQSDRDILGETARNDDRLGVVAMRGERQHRHARSRAASWGDLRGRLGPTLRRRDGCLRCSCGIA